jgi:hypothetical protein
MKPNFTPINTRSGQHLAIGVISLLALTLSASAAITIVGQGGRSGASVSGSFDYTYNVQQAGSVLVVATYVDGTAFSSMSFGGAAQTGAIAGSRTSLFYYTGTVGAGNITLSAVSGSANQGMYVWELSGVDKTAAVASAVGTLGDTNNTTITTTAANSFIVDAIGWNTTNAVSSTTVTLSPDANNTTLTENFSYEINLNTGGVLGGGSGTAGAAGTYNLGWTISQNDANTGRNNLNEVAFAFTPVPEPSTALLGGLGLLVLLRRRR